MSSEAPEAFILSFHERPLQKQLSRHLHHSSKGSLSVGSIIDLGKIVLCSTFRGDVLGLSGGFRPGRATVGRLAPQGPRRCLGVCPPSVFFLSGEAI